MVGESLSQVDIITRLMKAGTKTLAALHTIMTGWVGDSQFRILYTSRSQPEQQKDAKTKVCLITMIILSVFVQYEIDVVMPIKSLTVIL